MWLSDFLQRVVLPALLVLVPTAVLAQMEYPTSETYITPRNREIRFYGMRSYPFGRIPQNARQDALDHAAERNPPSPKARAMAAGGWRQHGPTAVGGRVRSIAVHPTDGRTLWIGAAAGGVWKSSDRGASWRPTMDGENSIAMGALAVAPSNPDVLFAGTGSTLR